MHSLQDFLPYVTAPAQCEDLLGFIKIIWFYLPIIGGDKIALRELALDFCRQQHANHIYYSEPRYTPWEVIGDADSAFSLSEEEAMEVILGGFEEGCRRYGIRIRSILSVLCEWDGDADARCKKTLALMQQYRHSSTSNPCGVVGLDIAGNEADRVAKQRVFDATFASAKRLGFHRTVHAGEAAGAESVEYALRNMCAERIGHGYKAVQSEQLMALLRAKSEYRASTSTELSMIHLECCPTSSVCTNAVRQYRRTDATWPHHPMRRFVREGVHFSLSQDDPMVFQCDMAEEIAVARHKLGMSWLQVAQCAIRGAEAAFIDDAKEKQRLIETVRRRATRWADEQQRQEAAQSKAAQQRNAKMTTALLGVAALVSGYILYRRSRK